MSIRNDLSRKMQRDLAEVLKRNLAVASHILEMPDLMTMMVEAAVMMCRSTAATTANSCSGSASTDQIAGIFNATYDTILDELARSRSSGLERTLAAVQSQSA